MKFVGNHTLTKPFGNLAKFNNSTFIDFYGFHECFIDLAPKAPYLEMVSASKAELGVV